MQTTPGEPVAATSERQHRVWPYLLLLGLLLALYPLSLGPVLILADGGTLPRRTVDLYKPVIQLCQHCPPAKRCLDWYLRDVWHWSPSGR